MNVTMPALSPAHKNLYRFATFVLVVVVSVSALSARMAYLQLFEGRSSTQFTGNESAQSSPIRASRGLIYDRTGLALVKNLPDFTVQVIPHNLPLSDKPRVVSRLAGLLGMDALTINREIDSAAGSLYNPVVIANRVPVDVARMIDENTDQLPGVQVVARDLRQYTNGPLFGEILGYTGHPTEVTPEQRAKGYSEQDVVGLAGLESFYEDDLRGTYGQATVALDAEGRPIPGLQTTITPPVAGSSLTLTLDAHEQALAYKALSWGLALAHVQMGVIIVMNPQNGEILAMVSLPGYDNNVFSQGLSQAGYQKMLTSPTEPLKNKAVQEQYAPGSTYKLVTGTAGLQGGHINASSTIMSMPYWQVGPTKYWEWNKTGWGPLNITMGLAHSSDTFFYQLAARVGLDSLSYWARQYGFGAPTGIDFPNEASGIVPDNQWKENNRGQKMYTGEIIQAGIGQGYDMVTPIQLINAYAALANGGNLWQPHLVKSITAPDGTVNEVQPQLIRKLPASAETLMTMRLATRAVVTSRHTYNLVDLPVVVAGKTGTAEFGDPDKYGRLPYHEWFVGYLPGDPYHGSVAGTDSQLVVAAFAYSAQTWGDISTEIVKYYLMLHFGLRGTYRPTDTRLPYAVNLWAFKRTNYYGSANNH